MISPLLALLVNSSICNTNPKYTKKIVTILSELSIQQLKLPDAHGHTHLGQVLYSWFKIWWDFSLALAKLWKTVDSEIEVTTQFQRWSRTSISLTVLCFHVFFVVNAVLELLHSDQCKKKQLLTFCHLGTKIANMFCTKGLKQFLL